MPTLPASPVTRLAIPPLLFLYLLLFLPAACGERRDAASVAAGIAPFDELRGISITALRVGEVRAFRRGAAPAPFEGLRERIGEWDLLYEVPGFVGTDGSWPPEDVQVLAVEATHAWPSDSLAAAAFAGALRSVRAETGATPSCLEITGPGFSLRVVEFDRGGGWTLAVAHAPPVTLATGVAISARHSIAVRRHSVTSRFPERGATDADDLPTWVRAECAGVLPA